MARPHKQTVDYFPHYCNHGKTIHILQRKFGNDGYSFWFRLLELLGKTEGHFYDYSNPAEWEFMLTETHVDEVTANNILSTLAELNAIDKELAEDKIIWCQHLVDNVSDVYKRRAISLPLKPFRDSKKTEKEAK